MEYPVVEIFDSVQGEGVQMGRVATFIRLAGCNLKCDWCDTDWTKGKQMTAAEIVAQVHQDFVVITGGEPTVHNLMELLEALHIEGKFIAIETNGTNSVKPYVGYLNWITCSPKPQNHYKIHPDTLRYVNELKYVVDDNFDVNVIPPVEKLQNAIWLQPEAYTFEKSVKKAWELVKKYPFLRLGIQAHKIWGVR